MQPSNDNPGRPVVAPERITNKVTVQCTKEANKYSANDEAFEVGTDCEFVALPQLGSTTTVNDHKRSILTAPLAFHGAVDHPPNVTDRKTLTG